MNSSLRVTAVAPLLLTAALVVAPLAIQPAAVAADPSLATESALCAQTQEDVALIADGALEAAGISVSNESFGDFGGADDYDRFVLSKSGVDPSTMEILATSFAELDPARDGLVKQVRCKVRTGESLDQGPWPEGSDNNSPGYERPPYFGFGEAAAGLSGGRGTCQTTNNRIVQSVWSALSPAEQEASAFSPEDGTLVTVPDEEAISGPLWTPEFEPVQIEDGVLTVRSKALYAPTDGPVGLTRFLGAHYCTLVGPDYLAALINENLGPLPTETPTASPSPTPTQTTTAIPSTAPDTDADVDADADGTADSDSDTEGASAGALPATGSNARQSALIGLASLALGLGLVARSRARGQYRPRHRSAH